jgi:hypothetical protein
MEKLFDAIRAATAPDANDDTKAAGADACRAILRALEAKPGEPLVQDPAPTTPVQTVIAALGSVPPEQLLDLAIAKLKAALPPGTELEPVRRLNLPLLPVTALRGDR